MSDVPVPSPSLSALILIADDSEEIRELYGEYLRLCGFQTEVATGGEDAVTKARKLLPAAIVMDLSMPSVDGVEAARRL